MTLDTRVYVQDRMDFRELFAKCNQLIGGHEGIESTDKEVGGERWLYNRPDQGLCALLDVRYQPDGPLTEPGQHDRYCDGYEDGCGVPCGVPCWLEVSFDTTYGYRGDNGEGCGDLHARLVAELGQWLDSRGIRWSWLNEFTGEVHQGYAGLTELGTGGAEASDWFRNIVVPAIAMDTIEKGR